MNNNFYNVKNPNPGEIVINKNHVAFRDKYSILMTEAYAMPSSTYVQDDSHAFLVSLDRTLCWANYGRCWNGQGDKILVAKQNSYKEWLMEFCPPQDLLRCGIIFGINGVCHTITNRELLIGENDVSVKDATKNFVTVSVFGKYGFGLNELKKLVKDSFDRANLKVMMSQDMLERVLNRIDNTLDDEVNAWKQLMENYFYLKISDIISEHNNALENLKNMVIILLEKREKIFNDYNNLSVIKRNEYEKQIFLLLLNNVYSYLDFLLNENYISKEQNNISKQNVVKFFKTLFKVVDGQIQDVELTGSMNQSLALTI